MKLSALALWCISFALVAPTSALAQRSGPLVVEPGARLGAVRLGMGHAELAELELAPQPPRPGRPPRFGPYQVVFAGGLVDRVGVRLGAGAVRAGGRTLRPGAGLPDVLAAFRHCVHRARGGVECEGNGVRVAPSEEVPGDLEVWVQTRREPLVLAPGAQLGPVRLGMSEEALRALPGVTEATPTVFHVDGVNAQVEDGRVVRARAVLARWGRLRVGEIVLDEGAPAAERERRLGCTRREPATRTACPGVSFAQPMSADEEVTVEERRGEAQRPR